MGGCLLDTHILIWLNQEPERVSALVRTRLEEVEAVYFSAASAWELEIKRSLGRLRFKGRIRALAAQAGLVELPVTARYAELSATLPMHHKDPFDRMLVAQAISEDLTLITADRRLSQYPVSILAV